MKTLVLALSAVLLSAAILLHGGIYKAVPVQGQAGDIPLFIVNAWTGEAKFCNGYNCFKEVPKEPISLPVEAKPGAIKQSYRPGQL